MNSRKIISVLLSLVLSIQVLPLQQIAAWLFSNQITEELTHSIKSGKSNSASEEVKHPFLLYSGGSGISALLTASQSRHLQDEALFGRHNDDILSPPPNC